MSSPSETVVLVIGIGNLLRGDDSVGRIVAQRLRERNIPQLQVLEQEGETMGLMEAWAGADTVFVVDAILLRSSIDSPRPRCRAFRNLPTRQ